MKPAQFSRILCPVSFSATSRRAVESAALLAAKHDCELRLFHAVSCGTDGERDAEALIASLFALMRHTRARIRISAAIGYGEPVQEILAHARLMHADLIVMGIDLRPASRAVGDTMPCSVATQSACPVLIARPSRARFLAERWTGFTEILSCVDFLPASIRAADHALALAECDHGRLTLVTVLEDEEDGAESIEDTIGIRRHLDEICTAARASHGVEAVLTGVPGPDIVGFANRVGSDLIVMGAHGGARPLRRLGATAAYVVTHAPCPVLIVPAAPPPRRGQRVASRRDHEDFVRT